MPYSEIAFYDLGLDDQVDEVPKTSIDSQRIVYEDFRVEFRRNLEAQTVAEAQSATTAESVAPKPVDPYCLESMESIIK